ncbi:MAG: hypothetical protein NZM06_02090 [Chloroherpetonaceae bacterium]|nr:hypothetical protein [Chloroherpetonaceae bacterium]MDW8438439.1 hypothetical protein [Chloroherpetonaceae bacterium]
MKRILLHSFLSLFLAVASLAMSHHHERRDVIAFADASVDDSGCAFCAMKSALQGFDESPRLEAVAPLSFRHFFGVSSSSLVSLFSSPTSSRAPPAKRVCASPSASESLS